MWTSPWLRSVGVPASLGVWLLASAAIAQPSAPQPDGNKELAKEWADRAKARFDEGDYKGAIQAIVEAEKHAHPPTFTRLEAQAYEKLGKLLEARALYQSIADMKLAADAQPAWVKAKEGAQAELMALLPRIPSLTISVVGADVATLKMTVDGAAFDVTRLGQPVATNPGKHAVVVEAPGKTTASKEVSLSEGATEAITIQLVPAPAATAPAPAPSAPGPQRTVPATSIAGYVALGVGGVGLILGGVTGGLAIAKRDEAEAQCGADYAAKRCAEDRSGALNDARTTARISTAGFVLAGVGAAAGTVLLLWPQKKPAVGVAVAPGLVTLKGAF